MLMEINEVGGGLTVVEGLLDSLRDENLSDEEIVVVLTEALNWALDKLDNNDDVEEALLRLD